MVLRLTVIAMAMLFACSEPRLPCDACREDRERVCLREQVCGDDGGCVENELGCAPRCGADAGCSRRGHRCVEDARANAAFCDPECENALCSAREECSSEFGDCNEVVCGRAVDCVSTLDFCDLATRTCRPLTGACRDLADCQTTDSSRTIACTLGFCRLDVRVPEAGRPAAGVVTVSAPTRGRVFPSQDAITIAWEGEPNPSIVLILDQQPGIRPIADAIWGAAVSMNVTRLTIADGVPIEDEAWQAGQSRALPLNQSLFLFVQQVAGDTLVGKSAAIPFRIGSDWLQDGSACVDDACQNPFLPLACLEGTCRQQCASHLDCERLGRSCSKRRICE